MEVEILQNASHKKEEQNCVADCVVLSSFMVFNRFDNTIHPESQGLLRWVRQKNGEMLRKCDAAESKWSARCSYGVSGLISYLSGKD